MDFFRSVLQQPSSCDVLSHPWHRLWWLAIDPLQINGDSPVTPCTSGRFIEEANRSNHKEKAMFSAPSDAILMQNVFNFLIPLYMLLLCVPYLQAANRITNITPSGLS